MHGGLELNAVIAGAVPVIASGPDAECTAQAVSRFRATVINDHPSRALAARVVHGGSILVGATLQAADWSFWQCDDGNGNHRHTADDMARLKRAGIDLIIPGAFHGETENPHVEECLRLGREAGMFTATYTVVITDGRHSVDAAKRLCGAEWDHLSFVAIDVEVEDIAVGVTVAQIAVAERRIRDAGQEPWIYTRGSFWREHVGNSTNFKHLRLWSADYDGDPAFDFQAPYGGWTKAMLGGKQFLNTHTFQGLEMDRSTFLREFVQEDDMTFIGVGTDRATIDTPQFESFRLYVTATGLVREKIPNKGEREALAAAGYPLLQLTKAQLKKYAER